MIKFVTKLFPHQLKCVEKLKKFKIGALYMEMGTGKTRTALELINMRLDKGKVDHVIWLCPCSVKDNLKRDIIKHTGSELKQIITICGIETLSSSLSANIKLRSLVKEKKCYLIVDESNLVKNFFAKRTKNIIELAKVCQYKLILNGTLITRNEADLFAQWYILDWRILGYKSYYSFSANHLEYDEAGKVKSVLDTDYLISKIAKYSYQVKKEECLDLPDKNYDISYFELTREQEEEYKETKEMFLAVVDEFDETTIYRLLTALQLVLSGERILNHSPKSKIRHESMFDNPEENPRLQALQSCLTKQKTIIFCKYTKEVNDICQVINKIYGQDSAVQFTGQIPMKKRLKNLEKFREGSLYLVANKNCAGYGLNLQFCNNIIYYTNDWDWGTRAQSEDRVHRIGQEENVNIIDICANNPLDRRILRCLYRKENLAAVMKEELEKQKELIKNDQDRIKDEAETKNNKRLFAG